MTIRHPAAAGWLIAGLLMFLAMTGCGGGNAASQATAAATQASSVQQQARTVWLNYARCVRSHGFPAFPDPQVDSQGRARFPSSPEVKSEGQRAQATCGAILGHLPAAAQGNVPVTPGMLHQEHLFAACVRRHGLTGWPDPRPDGGFPLQGTPYATEGKTGPVVAAFAACRQYSSFGGVKG
jgi:hypothetical protein